jgi:hypothetical protein
MHSPYECHVAGVTDVCCRCRLSGVCDLQMCSTVQRAGVDDPINRLFHITLTDTEWPTLYEADLTVYPAAVQCPAVPGAPDNDCRR